MKLSKKEIKTLLDMARVVLSGDDELGSVKALSLNIKAHYQIDTDLRERKETECRLAALKERLSRLEGRI